jgi:hypothetical protein
MLLHDLHYAEPDIITLQRTMLKQYLQQNTPTALLIETPPKHDAHIIKLIEAALHAQEAATVSQNNLFLTVQRTLGTAHTEPLLSQLGNINFDCEVQPCDHRALLFALSDALAINRALPSIKISFSIGQLVAAIKHLEHELIELQPVIADMPASLIPTDYRSCLATLRNYREQLNHLTPDENIFSSSENTLHNFFSWAVRSPTLCNLLLEATFIQTVQTCGSTSVIIVTGAYHAERLQTYFERNGFSVDHDSGITCNGKVVYQSYGHILRTIIPVYENISDAIRTIFTAITPLKKLVAL